MLLIRYTFVIFIFFIAFFGPYKAFLESKPVSDEIFIDVENGSSMYKSFSKIYKNNLLNKIFFKIYVFNNSIESFQAGEYMILDKNFTEIINAFNKGATHTRSITFNEGMNKYDIQNLIQNSYLINDCSFLTCLKTDYPFLEGIIFPDTYYYKKGMKASEIIIKSHARLDTLLDKLWAQKPLTNNLNNKYDALILASIIEKEAGNHQEKTLIAGVFLKRIDLGMKLQADPTIIYGLLPDFDGDIKKSDILDKNNIYNTYMIKGLPPSPISLASIQSIEASILSMPGEYLFFVANSPTSHHFSKTYEEHLSMIEKVGLNK